MVSGPIATHPSQLPTPPHPGNEATTTAPLGGALGQDAAEMCIFERNGYDSERDYCIPEHDSGSSEGVYVSLVNNPERFTGYTGDHAHAVWREIYGENCFELQPQDVEEEAMLSKLHMRQSGAKNDLEVIMLGRNKGRANGATVAQEYDQLRLENTCLEKRVFWRLISGMHTSISTHLCWDYLNQTTGEWVSFFYIFLLIPGTKSRMFQVSRMGLSSMDRKSVFQLRRCSTGHHEIIQLPRFIQLLLWRSHSRPFYSTKGPFSYCNCTNCRTFF